MLETIAVLLLQATTPTSPVWTPTAAPLSDEALALQRSGPLSDGIGLAGPAAPFASVTEWAGRFDSSVMPARLTTQIVEAMMQPDRADFGFNPGFLLTPGTTVTVLATINGQDFELR